MFIENVVPSLFSSVGTAYLLLMCFETYRPYGTKGGGCPRCYKHIVPTGLKST